MRHLDEVADSALDYFSALIPGNGDKPEEVEKAKVLPSPGVRG